MTIDLLQSVISDTSWVEDICPGAVVLRQYAASQADMLLAAVREIERQSPFRQMQTPSGHTMSVAITNCGELGWVSDRKGYRYAPLDPNTGQPWPAMPENLQAFARDAAAKAGFPGFHSDACLINRYQRGTKMGLHQDKDEHDFSAPIVSVSLGVPATFQFGGMKRSDRAVKVPLTHGDVVVWGGAARLCFHGVLTIRQAWHPMTGDERINLTFRKAC